MTLFGKRVFAEVIMLRILRWDHPGIEWALNPLVDVIRKEEKGEDSRGDHMIMEAAMSQGHRELPKLEEARKDPLPELLEGSWCCQHLDLALLASRAVRINFCCFKPPSM